MRSALRLGISTCPNDTFAFHALLAGELAPPPGEPPFEIVLLDVQELNERMLAGELDVAKVSFHAALRMARDVVVLPSGSALGHGVGPLVLAAEPTRAERVAPDARVLCPGEWTTATLLWRLFHPGAGRVEQVVFSAIMPALRARRADLGVCIHEGRFTWREQGLALVEDLGDTWASRADAPLPLGGLVARRSLGPERVAAVQTAVRASLEWGHAHPAACLASMRRWAQELADDVLRAHVELYVNERTLELGAEGGRALDALARLAGEAGVVAPGTRLEIARA